MGGLVASRVRPAAEEGAPRGSCCGCQGHRGRRRLEAVLLLCVAAPAAGKKDKGPLCHAEFRALERCLGSDYDRLRGQCARDYDGVRACLERDWRHIDDAGGYKRAAGSFNRVKRCRHGVMLYNPLDWYIGRGLEVYGEWGEKKVQIWQRIVKAGHVAIDVGAHVGALTLPLSSLVGEQGRVVAFEPFYPSFATLAANVGLNSLQNVEVRQAVVADRVGRVFMNRRSLAFKMNDFFNFGSISFNNLRIYNATDDVERASTDWDEYPVTSLDQMSLGRLDFVKIDAEAMELSVLVGATRMIKRFKPLLFLEYRNPWEKDTEILAFLQQKLRYECVLLRLPVVNPENYRGHAEDIWGIEARLVSFNLLCKHRWWEYPDMDDAVLELFDTAVDTDVEGLRTTPTADPFESLGRAPEAAAGEAAAAAASSARPAAAAGRGGKGQRQPKKQKRFEDMTLDELLDDGYADEDPAPPSQPPAAASRAVPLAAAPSAAQPAGGPAKSRGAGKQPPRSQQPQKAPGTRGAGKPVSKEAQRAGQAKTHGTGKQQAPGRREERQQQREPYKEMTLDELMEETSLKASPQGELGEDPSLEELLQGASQGDVGGMEGGEKDVTLEELLGAEEDGEAERYKDLTLEELLGPDPGEDEASSLDDLLGDNPSDPKYEDMSLEELLALDDPAPAPQPARPQQPAAGSTAAAAGAKKQKPGGGKPKKGGGKATKKAAEEKPGAGATKKKPHVRVSYQDEVTLDEL